MREISCEKVCSGGAAPPVPLTRTPFLSEAGSLRSSFIPTKRGAGTLLLLSCLRLCSKEVGERWVTLGRLGKVIVGKILIGGPSRIGLGWGIEEETVWSARVPVLRGRWILGFFVSAFLIMGLEVK